MLGVGPIAFSPIADNRPLGAASVTASLTQEVFDVVA